VSLLIEIKLNGPSGTNKTKCRERLGRGWVFSNAPNFNLGVLETKELHTTKITKKMEK